MTVHEKHVWKCYFEVGESWTGLRWRKRLSAVLEMVIFFTSIAFSRVLASVGLQLWPQMRWQRRKSHKENVVKISSAVGWFCCRTVYEFSRWEKLQSSRSFSPPPAVSCVQPSPAGPFFCLVLVAPSLICRETGTLCQCSPRFYSPLSPADIQSTNYHHEQQEANWRGNRNPCHLDVA